MELCRDHSPKPLSDTDTLMLILLQFCVMILARLGEVFGNNPETLRWRNIFPANGDWHSAQNLAVLYDWNKQTKSALKSRKTAVGNASEY